VKLVIKVLSLSFRPFTSKSCAGKAQLQLVSSYNPVEDITARSLWGSHSS